MEVLKMVRFFKIMIPAFIFFAFAIPGSNADNGYLGQNIIRNNAAGTSQNKQIKTWIDFEDESSVSPDRKRSHKRRRKVKPSKETR